MITGENKALLKLRIVQSFQKFRRATTYLHDKRVANVLDGNTSRDENGKAFGVNDHELNLIERVLSRLFYDVDRFPETAEYFKWRRMIHDQCEQLDQRIMQIYTRDMQPIRSSHRH